MVLTMIVGVLLRIIMNWVFNNTKGSILIAVLLHASLDASNSGSAYIRHLLPASQLGGYGFGATLLAPLIVAVMLLIFTKGRLSYKPDRVVQPVTTPQPAEASLTEI